MSNILLQKNYEEYLITNMKRCQTENPTKAKAWMITAKSLFPNDFFVQYEAYKMEREMKNTKQAACYFSDLTKKFPNEPGLLQEMQRIADALRSKLKNDDVIFLKNLFKCLNSEMKYKILTTVANHCKDPMKHCSLMLLLLQELPSQLFQHGEKVIDTLLAAENLSHCNHPVNPYRKLLVCDATPTILFTPNFKLSPKVLFCLLQAAIEFFVCYIFAVQDDDLEIDMEKIDKDEPLMTTKSVHNVWKSLFVLMKTVGQQLHWSLVELFSSRVNLILEMSWEKVSAMVRKKLFSEAGDHGTLLAGGSYEGSPHEKEVFFCTSVIFFYSLYQFAKLVGPKFFPNSNSGDVHYILIEGIRLSVEDESLESVTKRFKYDRDAKKVEKGPSITVSRKASPDSADNLTQSFSMSIKIWELIHRNYSLGNDFTHLCQIIEMDKWPCFQEFFINTLIYQGCHKEAITHLTHIHGATVDPFMKNKACLQLASCLSFIGEHVRACEYLFDVICSFPTPVISSSDAQIPSSRSCHHLHFIAYTLDEILHFCIELLIVIYKKKMHVSLQDNIALGHLLILSQYKWPREEDIFLQCIHQIQQNGSFCFSKFFDYIIVPGVLEEFMYLTTPSGGSVTLDLLPTSTMQVGKQRAVTRGVNKGAKEDLTETMKKQMARCEESMDDLFVTFIRQERHYIKIIIG